MTKAHEKKLMEAYHLDRSLPVQYLIWLKNLSRGDLGRSIIEKRPVAELLRHHLPYSLSLGLTAIAISFVLGVSMGIVSAAAKDTIIDRIAMVVALFGVTIPAFWLGLILILCFAVWLTWFPVSGSGSLATLVLPAITVGLGAQASSPGSPGSPCWRWRPRTSSSCCMPRASARKPSC